MTRILFLFVAVALCGCNGPYRGENVVGADEFVMDSHQIAMGKFSILDLQGKNTHSHLPNEYLEEQCDAIHEDDVLGIMVHHPSKSALPGSIERISKGRGYPVVNGAITLPELGMVSVAGLTLEEAARKIQDEYMGSLADVEVFLSYSQRRWERVELAGLVQAAAIPTDGKLRLWDVLAQAKVSPEANLFASYVIRDNTFVPVDLTRLLIQGDMSQNIVMRGGDKVYIADPATTHLLVMGEVRQPRSLPLPRGTISLRDALAAAGGIPYTGDRRYIQVIRGGIVNPKIYTLNWKHIVALPNESLLCMPGDIVYVATTPLADWSRFVMQLLPTYTAIESLAKGVKDVGIQVGLPGS